MAKQSKASVAAAMGVNDFIRPIPSLTLDNSLLDGIESKRVGDTMKIEVELEVTGVRKNKWLQGNPIETTVDIISIDGKKTKRKLQRDDNSLADV